MFFLFLEVGLYCYKLSASLVALRLEPLPAMWETWVQSLSWEDPLEKDRKEAGAYPAHILSRREVTQTKRWAGEIGEPMVFTLAQDL